MSGVRSRTERGKMCRGKDGARENRTLLVLSQVKSYRITVVPVQRVGNTVTVRIEFRGRLGKRLEVVLRNCRRRCCRGECAERGRRAARRRRNQRHCGRPRDARSVQRRRTDSGRRWGKKQRSCARSVRLLVKLRADKFKRVQKCTGR